MARVPEAGRNWEGFGGDPFLAGEAAFQTVTGMQSAGVIACAKHWLANEQEASRTNANSIVDDRTIHEIYGWPFMKAVQAGVASVMCAFNLVNNTYSCENPRLQNQILRAEYGFQGFIVSDWEAAHNRVPAAKGGLDMTMPTPGPFNDLDTLVGSSITQAEFDAKAINVLKSFYKFQMETGYPTVAVRYSADQGTTVNSPVRNVQGTHATIVRAMGADSAVLLKNIASLGLPLSKTGGLRIAVIGTDATAPVTPVNYAGGLYREGTLIQGWGSGTTYPPYIVAPISAITAAFGGSTRVTLMGNDFDLASARSVARAADVAIVFVKANSGEGYITYDANAGDRKNLTLWFNGDNLINTVAAVNRRTIVVMHTVGQVDMPWANHVNISAILMAGLPGQETGNSLVDVLSGDVNPSGKLVYTIAANVNDYNADIVTGTSPQVPYTEGLKIDYRYFDTASITPRYAFGFGLSYTTFAYSNLVITGNPPPSNTGDDVTTIVTVQITVRNTGTRDGKEVAQLYIGYPASLGEPPKVLKGFEKQMIVVGASVVMTFPLTARELSWWDVVQQKWQLSAGTYTAFVGASSRDIRQTGTFYVGAIPTSTTSAYNVATTSANNVATTTAQAASTTAQSLATTTQALNAITTSTFSASTSAYSASTAAVQATTSRALNSATTSALNVATTTANSASTSQNSATTSAQNAATTSANFASTSANYASTSTQNSATTSANTVTTSTNAQMVASTAYVAATTAGNVATTTSAQAVALSTSAQNAATTSTLNSQTTSVLNSATTTSFRSATTSQLNFATTSSVNSATTTSINSAATSTAAQSASTNALNTATTASLDAATTTNALAASTSGEANSASLAANALSTSANSASVASQNAATSTANSEATSVNSASTSALNAATTADALEATSIAMAEAAVSTSLNSASTFINSVTTSARALAVTNTAYVSTTSADAIMSTTTAAAAAPKPVFLWSKVGLAWSDGDVSNLWAVAGNGWNSVSWLFTYSPWNVHAAVLASLDFVPMLSGCDAVADFEYAKKQGLFSRATAVLTFWEPESHGLDAMTAVAVWRDHVQPLRSDGLNLGAPAVASTEAGKNWLALFFQLCRGCTVGFVPVHWFGENCMSFQTYMADMYKTFNKPLWVIEWACVSDKGACTDKMVSLFVKCTTSWMDSQSWVQRYAYYGARRDLGYVNRTNALLTEDGFGNTQLGVQYVQNIHG
eukprot:TRINITY_DN705_c0_g2_i2.p1 TRINITY_DN705_c0_g2~~TRINITY_DN705_c0_g2_i2.p1  ORF type:complete len:1398 (+),score=355.49 TRINITY_DN705_c0_g2_i2:540-4196(+)